MKTLSVFFLALAILVAYPAEGSGHKKPRKKTYHTKKYKKHHKGLRRSAESRFKMLAMPHLSYLHMGSHIPGQADLSASVSLPEDQGACGGCWAFSLSKALRSEYMLKATDPGQLEFNYLINNCGKGPRMGGCNGGDFAAAMSFENDEGPGLNSLDPFVGRDHGRCKHLPVKATALSYAMLGSGSSGPTFKDVAYAVGVEKHMLSIDVAAGAGDWESYSDGIFNDCQGGPGDVDHMIDLVGYDCQTSIDPGGNCAFTIEGRPINGDGYLIVENNWGESWGTKAANGHGGYMKTRMYAEDGSKCNAIAQDALMFTIDTVPLSILPEESPRPK